MNVICRISVRKKKEPPRDQLVLQRLTPSNVNMRLKGVLHQIAVLLHFAQTLMKIKKMASIVFTPTEMRFSVRAVESVQAFAGLTPQSVIENYQVMNKTKERMLRCAHPGRAPRWSH